MKRKLVVLMLAISVFSLNAFPSVPFVVNAATEEQSEELKSFVTLGRIVLEENFKDHYETEIKDNSAIIKVWGDSVGLAVHQLLDGEESLKSSWETLKSSMQSLSNSMYDLFTSICTKDEHLIYYVVNDQDKNEIFMQFEDNFLSYDIVDGEHKKSLLSTSEIEEVITNRIKEKYMNTEISSITINENYGTNTPDDYIALVNLVWNVQNSAGTTNEMLSMYSNDLAATVANSCDNVQEIAVFWEVPYHGKNSKYSFERKGKEMYLSDKMEILQ